MNVYRDVLDSPTVIFHAGKLGVINVDFISENDCLVTCTDDIWKVHEKGYKYLFYKGKHIFTGYEWIENDFIFSWSIGWALTAFQIAITKKINSLL